MDIGKPSRSAYRIELGRSGYYEIRWSEKNADGSWRTRATSTRKKAIHEAERVLAGFISAEEDYTPKAGSKFPDLTIRELTEFYIAGRIERRGTWQDGAKAIRYRMVPFADYKVSEITIDFVDHWLEKTSKRMKPSSQGSHLKFLRSIIRFAIRKQKIDPTNMPLFEVPGSGEPRVKFLDEAQEAHLWSVAESFGGDVFLFTAIALSTGARREAIFELEWDRVNIADRVIDFRRPGRNTGVKRRTVVPILSRLLPVLKAYKRERGRVLADTNTIRTLNNRFAAVTKAAGLPWVTPHVCRHTCATLMLRRGIDLWTVAGLLGDTVGTVDKVYGHHAADHTRRVIDGHDD